MSRLRDLRLAPLELRLQTEGPFRAPEYMGALFRGGFGQIFRDLVCTTGMPVCKGCPHLLDCPYSVVFETPVLSDRFPVLRKYPNAPHPFVMTPPPGAGLEMRVGLTLVGLGIEYLPQFLGVFEAMGRSGRYGGRFRVRSAVSSNGDVVYDGLTRRLMGRPAEWVVGEANGPVRRIRVNFVTPLRMRTEGRYNTKPNFVAVTQALLRRLHLLLAIYGDGDADTGWMKALLASADRAVMEGSEWRMYEWSRMSGRQGRRVEMDGVLGWVEASGDLTDLAQAFRVGEWVHVGNGTSMGLGKYTMEVG